MLKLLPVLIILGTLIYLGVRLVQRPGEGGSRPRPRRPVAPDDNPGFLRDLDEKLWRDRHDNSGTE